MVLMRSSRYKKHKQMEVLPDMKKALRLFDRFLYWVETLTSTCALIVITALVFGQVILRYLFSKSMPWAEEVIITLIIAMAMFGAARGVRSHAHVDVVGVANILPWWSAYILRAITTLIAIVLLVLTTYACFYLASMTKSVTVMLRYPQKWTYWIMGTGAGLTAYEFLKITWKRIKGEY